MNSAGYMIFVICVLASMTDRNTRVYFGSFGLMMLGHYFVTWPLSAENFDYAYLSSAALCFFMWLVSFQDKDNLFFKIVCGSCVFVNFVGWSLWGNSLSIELYDNLYLGIYSAVALYLIPRAYNDGLNKVLRAFRRLYGVSAINLSKHLGHDQ